LRGQRITLAGGFVEEDGGGSGGVERLDAGNHGNAEAGVGAALDFFWQTGTFVADEESNGFAPIHFPGSEVGLIAIGRFTESGGKSADSRDAKLRENNGKGHARENGKMKRCTGGSTECFGRKRAGGAALARRGGDGGGSTKGCGGAENSADVAGILDTD